MGLPYVGVPQAGPKDLTTKAYIDALVATFLPQSQVDTLITNGLAPYVTRSYVDTQDGLNATKAFIDAGDATRLHLAQRNVVNGVAGLDAQGRVDIARLAMPSTQRYPKPFYSPAAYPGSPVNVTTEVTLYQMAVTDPGFTYRLLVFGLLDAKTNRDGEFAMARVRVGNASSGPIAAQGFGCAESYFWGVDDFNRTSAVDLGATLWAQYYTVTTGGILATPNGDEASWLANGTDAVTCKARRINPQDALTVGNFQKISYTVGATAGVGGGISDADPSNNLYGRMSADATSYVKCRTTPSNVQLYYATGGAESTLSGNFSLSQASGDVIDFYCGVGANERQFLVNRNGTAVLPAFTDSSNVSPLGPANRGWGFGMDVSTRTAVFVPIGQRLPASMDAVAISDPGNPITQDSNYGEIVLMPTTLETQSPITGATTLYVRVLRSGAASVQTVSPLKPALWAVPIPA